MSSNKIFSEIISQLTQKYSIKSNIIPSYRFIENDKYLYIILRLIKDSEFNPYKDFDIYFSIILDDKFPESLPIVKCITDFFFPNLYDNSNLYKSILLFHISDVINKKEEHFSILEEIILGLKPFLDEIKKNHEENNFFYYGEYTLDEIYDINDFLGSQKNEFFRVNQIIKGNKNIKYIILNDVYFLLFDPVPNALNYAKLIFYGDIMNLVDLKDEQNGNIINMEFSHNKFNKNKIINLSLEFENKYNDFLNSKNERINQLKNKYKIFDLKDEQGNNKDDYNTQGFKISKSYEGDL